MVRRVHARRDLARSSSPMSDDLTISYQEHRRHLKAVESLLGKAIDHGAYLKKQNEELTAALRESERNLLNERNESESLRCDIQAMYEAMP